jgi:hypothetical protein
VDESFWRTRDCGLPHYGSKEKENGNEGCPASAIKRIG